MDFRRTLHGTLSRTKSRSQKVPLRDSFTEIVLNWTDAGRDPLKKWLVHYRERGSYKSFSGYVIVSVSLGVSLRHPCPVYQWTQTSLEHYISRRTVTGTPGVVCLLRIGTDYEVTGRALLTRRRASSRQGFK